MCVFLRWFLDIVNKPKPVFHEFQMWLTDIPSSFAPIFQEDDFKIKKIHSLSNDYWNCFQTTESSFLTNSRQETYLIKECD